MTKAITLMICLALANTAALAKGASHAVKGHTKKNATYVAPSRAADTNKSQRDNYGTKGNTNPASGKQGTRYASR